MNDMDNNLSVISWHEQIQNELDCAILGRRVDELYCENPLSEKLKYHRDTISNMYYKQVMRGDFNIETLLEEVSLHDDVKIDTAIEIFLLNASPSEMASCIEDYSRTTRDDVYSVVREMFCNDLEIWPWIDYPPTSNEDLPLIVRGVLYEIGGYFEFKYPPQGSWEAYNNHYPLLLGHQDSQAVLFPQMTGSDTVLVSAKSGESKITPVHYRLNYNLLKSNLKLKGETP